MPQNANQENQFLHSILFLRILAQAVNLLAMSQQPSRPGPFFCTQLLFVPPTPGQPAKPDDISQHPDKALAQNLLWKAGTVLHVRFFDGVKEVQDKVSKILRFLFLA